MAGRRSVVRWRDWCEWQDVHARLFSEDIYEQQRAISRVAAWRSRGDVPISVNATAQLVEIAVHEHMADHQHHAIGVSARSHMELSLAYASAIVRCVNGLVDCSQKGTYAMAVSALAQRIGIPLWIVDLRHESTHNQLPSLPVLRFAANHLLAWLRSNYWFKQEEVLRAQVRQAGEALLSRPPWASKDSSHGGVGATALKDLFDTEKLRDALIPLLMDGHQYGEQILPTGALFLAEFMPEADAAKTVSEVDALSRYPQEDLIKLIVDLQSVWSSWSACLLAALCQKLLRVIPLLGEDTGSAEIEVGLFWVKMLISNEWRERIKYAEEPIEEIYRSGASMLALSEQASRGGNHTGLLLERLRTTLRGCKGIRNHSIVTRAATVRKQLDASTEDSWQQLAEWNACPLGQLNAFTDRETEAPAEFPLDLDHESSLVYTPLAVDVPVDEDEAIDQLMESLDGDYDREREELLALERSVHEHVVQGSHASSNQKVLPQQEVERIQNEIEIW